ncbi:MAG: DUF885 family protein [Planctomycetes bacterium]|nr:DUF885 family protein [Planctomycetota bacterium]
MPPLVSFLVTARWLSLVGFVCVAPSSLAQRPLAPSGPSELRERIETFSADLGDLRRRYDTPMSGERAERFERRYREELAALQQLDFDALGRDGRVDWLLLDNHVKSLLAELEQERSRDAELLPLLPFAPDIVAFCEQRRAMQDVEPEAAAATVTAIGEAATAVRDALRRGQHDGFAPAVRERAAGRLLQLRSALQGWFRFRDGYDPMFSWWVRAPHEATDKALGELGEALRAPARGQGEVDRTLIGDPIGEVALGEALRAEWIPYTPAELVQIAEREFAWCDAEMQKATEALGAADWREALERTKQSRRPPGEQPALIRDLAHEAIDFLEARDLITIPDLAKECWRMRMMRATRSA